MNNSRAMLAAMLAATAMLAGCPPTCPPWESVRPLDEVVEQYNANAAAVPRVWARAKVAATVRAEGRTIPWGSTSPLASPNALLLLSKVGGPAEADDFALIGFETGRIELFRLGSNSQQGLYYFWLRFGDRGGAWWGRQQYAGAPGIEDLPIDPNQLLAVLGIIELPGDLTQLPGVGVTMSTDPCAYVLTYVARQGVTGRILFRRQMFFRWSLAEPPRLFMVRVLDDRGRPVMIANVSDYQPIRMADVATQPEQPTVMPTDIRIEWPIQGSSLNIVLSEMTTADIWDVEETRFEPPAGLPPQSIQQVDRGIGGVE